MNGVNLGQAFQQKGDLVIWFEGPGDQISIVQQDIQLHESNLKFNFLKCEKTLNHMYSKALKYAKNPIMPVEISELSN